jgi:hypothetical protein
MPIRGGCIPGFCGASCAKGAILCKAAALPADGAMDGSMSCTQVWSERGQSRRFMRYTACNRSFRPRSLSMFTACVSRAGSPFTWPTCPHSRGWASIRIATMSGTTRRHRILPTQPISWASMGFSYPARVGRARMLSCLPTGPSPRAFRLTLPSRNQSTGEAGAVGPAQAVVLDGDGRASASRGV